jgi:hypothetical protein
MPYNRQNRSIWNPDSPNDWFQLNQHWFQIELDELYRFYDSRFPSDPSFPLKMPENYQKLVKSQYFQPGFAQKLLPT